MLDPCDLSTFSAAVLNIRHSNHTPPQLLHFYFHIYPLFYRHHYLKYIDSNILILMRN